MTHKRMTLDNARTALTTLAAILLCSQLGWLCVARVHAATEPNANTKPAAAQKGSVYYPNTEPLGAEQMRVIALGTGTPNPRRSQASSCWLIELGNGDKFLFDFGTGCLANLAVLEIPYSYLDKVFLTHLHVDHIGDLDALFIGGWVSNRVGPLHVWGPSGAEPELGTAYALDHLQKTYTWDVVGRRGRLPSAGGELVVTEFDYAEPQEVYNASGVVIRSWPAIHVIDGAVSFSLSWNDYKFVFSGDTYPNSWFLKEARDADLLVHEVYYTVQQLMDYKNYPLKRAQIVSTVVHTPPEAAGKVFTQLQPRMAVAYHFFNDHNIGPEILAGIRSTYAGPLRLANDLMVWNIARDAVTVRTVGHAKEVWPASPPIPAAPANPEERIDPSPWLRNERLKLGD